MIHREREEIAQLDADARESNPSHDASLPQIEVVLHKSGSLSMMRRVRCDLNTSTL